MMPVSLTFVLGITVSRLPWLIVAIFGFLAFARGRSLPTLLQAIGATVLTLSMVFDLLLRLAPVHSFLGGGFSTVQFLLLLAQLVHGAGVITFAVGFCIEKARQAKPNQPATAFPIHTR